MNADDRDHVAIRRQGRPGERLRGVVRVEGQWTTLSRNSRSYLGTSFLRDQNQSSRYIVIEYWSEMVVYEQHKAYRSDAITSLEEHRTGLVER